MLDGNVFGEVTREELASFMRELLKEQIKELQDTLGRSSNPLAWAERDNNTKMK